MRPLSRSSICLLLFSLPAIGGSSAPGIHNFRQVDAHVYRGGQPTTSAGLAYLAKIGVKTVLDLRETGKRSDTERQAVTALGMQYVSVPMGGLAAPTHDQITKILPLLEDKATGPVFVHCRRGADRTGAVIGAYRIDFDHWDNTRAVREALADGMSFFQLPRQRYIREFQARTVEAAAASPIPFENKP